MRLPVFAVALVAAAAFGAQGAGASPQGPWTLPLQYLAEPGLTLDPPQLAVSPDGVVDGVWSRDDGDSMVIQAASRMPGGLFGPAVDLSSTGTDAEDPRVAAGPDGSATVVWRRSNVIQQSTRLPGGAFGPTSDISVPGGSPSNPDVQIAPDGTTTAVWRRSNGANFIIQASTRPPGGTFGAPVDLSDTGQNSDSPRVSTAPDGTTTAVWTRSNGANFIIQTSTRPPGGTFGAPIDLSEPGQNAFSPSLSTAPDGTTTAVWRRSNGANFIIQASTRPPGGTFGAPVDLSDTGQNSDSPRVSTAPDGTTTAVWTRSNGANFIIQTSTRPPGGTFGAPIDLSEPGQNASSPSLSTAPDGTTTAVWTRSNGANFIIQTSTRPPGGSFGTTVDLSAQDDNGFGPDVVTAPDGTATAAWGGGGPLEFIQSSSTARPSPLLGITKQGSGSGTVTSTPAGIDCGPVCASTFASYTPVTLTASAGQGSSFSGWSGAGCSGTGTCQVTMLQATTVTATFAADPPAGKPRLAAVTINPVKRKVRRKGKVALKVRVKNNGNAPAKSLRLCARGPKNLVRIPKCRTRSSLAAGKTWTVTVKVTVKARARRKAKARVTFDATARSVARRSRTAVITVR